MDITASTRITELLAEYPALEKRIIGVVPSFENLHQPALRETVGKLTTLERVAIMGGLDVNEFLNSLRREVGQPALDGDGPGEIELREPPPEWMSGQPVEIVDGTEMLNRGEHPLKHVTAVMQSLGAGQFVLLKTNFVPAPLIDVMEKQGYEVHSTIDARDARRHYTLIGKR
jgi:hypothetical protein